MTIMQVARADSNCMDCGFCKYFACKWGSKCTGCGACVIGCPNNARELVEVSGHRNTVKVAIDGVDYQFPENITILKALEIIGCKINLDHSHEEEGIHAPCRTGGCGECNVVVNGAVKPSCVTPVEDGMDIVTDQSVIKSYPPQRIVTVLNKNIHEMATMYGIKEISFFMHGCNMQCSACHNWNLTFSNIDKPSTPDQLVRQLFNDNGEPGVNRIGISGGEATLNRRWLLEFIRKISTLAPKQVRIQLDTNASLLNSDYIEALIDAGLTDISPDIKAATLQGFQRLTGINDPAVADRYLNNTWQSVSYILEKCEGRLFTVVGIPYHKDLVTAEELYLTGKKLAGIKPDVPVNLIEYQPAFRNRDLAAFTEDDSDKAMQILLDAGLKNVLCQSADDMPMPVDPFDILFNEDCSL